MVFALDARLEADTFALGESSLSVLRVLDDVRYAWLVLVPKREESSEWFELAAVDRSALFEETMRVAQALRDAFQPTKINLGQLGNVVRQLHVHVVARRADDPAWPGPVWGHSARTPYTSAQRALFVAQLKRGALSKSFDLP